MTHTTASRRMGNKMAEVLIEDFKASGYLAMFTEERRNFTIKTEGKILTIRSFAEAGYTHIHFIVSDAVSGRTETLEHRYPARTSGWTKVMREISAQWELDMLWLCHTLAVMLDKLYLYYNIDGTRKELNAGGKGYSGIAKDAVAGEWDRFRHEGALSGGGSL